MKVNYVVVDSGPIIKGAMLEKFSKHAICCPGVIKEIKDLKTRERMRNLPPYFFSVKSPSDKAINHVISVSKQTGDLKVLSKVDIEVLALAYEMQYLKTPQQVEDMFEKLELYSDDEITEKKSSNDNHFKSDNDDKSSEMTDSEGESLEVTDSEEESSEVIDSEEDQSEHKEENELENELNNLNIEENKEDVGEIFTTYTNLEDNDGWVTAENVDYLDDFGFGFSMKSSKTDDKVAIDELEVIPLIGCLTTDYAMQNVLFKMNITILSVNGMVIKEPRIFVSYCRSCFKNFRRVDIYFCPNCGNDSLGKVPAKIKENGEIEMFLKKNFKPNLRNTKFSIPNPTGGKHRDGNFYIYCADQKIPMERTKKSKNTFDIIETQGIPFIPHDVSTRAAILGITERKFGNLKPSRPKGNRNSKYKK